MSAILWLLAASWAAELEILEPNDGAVLDPTQPIVLSARGTGEVRWSSDIAGTLGTGSRLSLATLAPGAHALQASAGEDSVTIQIRVNTPPGPPTVTLSPKIPAATDSLVVTLVSESPDPDGDAVEYRYTWLVDGEPSDASNRFELPAAATRKGQVWTVRVTPNDGTSDGPATELSVTIDNAPPTVRQVSLSHRGSAESSEDITCRIDAVNDPDDSDFESRFRWTEDGEELAHTEATLPASLTRAGTAVICHARAFDGLVEGNEFASPSVTITSVAPSARDARITPAAPKTTSTLTCAAEVEDPDGDPVSFEVVWRVNGREIPGDTTLEQGFFAKGDRVGCRLVPTDGAARGEPVDAAPVTIGNSPPQLTQVVVEPSTRATGQPLRCVPVDAADADGDDLTFRYRWLAGDRTIGRDGVLPGAEVGQGAALVCAVQPFDGSEAGPEIRSAVVALGNNPPVTRNVRITPISPKRGDSLTCAAEAEDPDDEPVTLSLTWTVDDQPAGEGERFANGFVRGQTVACHAKATDGKAEGNTASAEVVVSNSPPRLQSASVSPADPRPDNPLTCASAGGTDPDGDEVVVTYAWFVDDAKVEASGATLAPGRYREGQRVRCEATPHDGAGAGETVSAWVGVAGSPPSVLSVKISPDQAATTEALTCVARASADGVALRYAWTVDGKPAGTGATLAAGSVKRGQRVICTVTPSNESQAGAPVASAPLTVGNAAPTGGSVQLSPQAADVSSTLSCAAQGAVDPDGDAVSYRYRFVVGGEKIDGATLLPGRFDHGDSLYCEAIPTDGTAQGPAVRSRALSIDNSLPRVGRVLVEPTDPTGDEDLSCRAEEATDPDGDPVRLLYAWTVNERAVGKQSKLPARHVRAGDTVTCTVTPSDGKQRGAPLAVTVELRSKPPALSSVKLLPENPSENRPLSCEPGEALEHTQPNARFTYLWVVDGERLSHDAPELPPRFFDKGQRVQCSAIPWVGAIKGEAVPSEIAVIGNSRPRVQEARVEAEELHAGDHPRCLALGAEDPDGDELTVRYEWFVDAVAKGVGAIYTGSLKKGQLLACAATVTDGQGKTTVRSPSVPVLNSPPVVTEVRLLPRQPRTQETLKASVLVEDADGDEVSVQLQWFVDDEAIVAQGAELAGQLFDKGQRVTIEAIPTDGEDRGQPVRAPERLVVNTPPSAPRVKIEGPLVGSKPLVCTVIEPAIDPDGDPLDYRFAWTADDAVQAGLDATHYPGDTVPVRLLSADQQWACEAVASDGEATSPTVKATYRSIDPRLDSGAGHSCGLRADGRVVCWGLSEHGQSDVPAGRFLRVSTGAWHSCGVSSEGSRVVCWGRNQDGQADAPESLAVTEVAAGGRHTCALVASDRTLQCWGSDEDGRSTPPGGAYRALAAGWGHSCAIATDGTARCWGSNDAGQSAPPQGYFQALSVGDSHSCALTATATLACWGDDTHNQLQAPSGRFVALAAGGDHTCAIREAGEVQCWGREDQGQTRPVRGTYTAISAGSQHSCGWTAEERVRCWGANDHGQLQAPDTAWQE